MTVYVLDSTALHAIPYACGGSANTDPLLLALGELIDSQDVCFCRSTVDALKILSAVDPPAAWASRAMKGMWHPGTDWYEVQDVVVQIENDMVAELLDDEPELPYLVAMAISIGPDAVIVTEDDIDKPEMPSAVSVCNKLGVQWITFADFAAATGIDEHFA